MRNIFPTSIWNAIHIAQIKMLPSNLESAHCILILKLRCLWTDILGKTKGSLDLEHQPWPECARPLSSHRQPWNFACPGCQGVRRPTQVWAEVIAQLWVDPADSDNLAADWEACLFHCYLVVFLPVSLTLLYSRGFDSGICIVGNHIYIKTCLYSTLAEGGRRGKPFFVVKSEKGKW